MENVSRHERVASRFNVSQRTIYRELNSMGVFVTCSQDGIYCISALNEAEDKLLSLNSLSERTGLGE